MAGEAGEKGEEVQKGGQMMGEKVSQKMGKKRGWEMKTRIDGRDEDEKGERDRRGRERELGRSGCKEI